MPEDICAEVLARLREMDIPFDLLFHEPVHTIDDCAFHTPLLHGCGPRNLFLTPRRRSAFYLALLRPHAPFQTSLVSRQVGSSRLSFADEGELLSILHTSPGAVSPLALLFSSARDVRLLIDRELQKEARLVFHPCVNTASLSMTSADFFKRFLPMTGHDVTWIDVMSGQ